MELSTAVAAFEVGVTYLVGSGWHGAEAGRQVCRRGGKWAGCNAIMVQAHGWEPCEVGFVQACFFRALPCHARTVCAADLHCRNNCCRRNKISPSARSLPPLQEHGEEEEAEVLYDCRVALARLRALQLLDGGVAGSEAAHDALNRLLEVGGVASVLQRGAHWQGRWGQSARAAAMQQGAGSRRHVWSPRCWRWRPSLRGGYCLLRDVERESWCFTNAAASPHPNLPSRPLACRWCLRGSSASPGPSPRQLSPTRCCSCCGSSGAWTQVGLVLSLVLVEGARCGCGVQRWQTLGNIGRGWRQQRQPAVRPGESALAVRTALYMA